MREADRKTPSAAIVAGGVWMDLGGLALLGALAGYYLDRRLGTSPWLVLAGTLVGTALGLYDVYWRLKQFGGKSNGASR